MTELFRRIQYLLNRRRLERELSEEMAGHREMMTEAKSDVDPVFGSQLRLIESSREVWGWCWLDRLFQDLRYGLRLLWKSPGFALTAVLILALGIGVNLTAFRLLLLETTPTVRDPDSLVEVARWFPNGMGTTIAYPVLAFYSEHAHSFRSVIAAHEESVVFGETTSGYGTPDSAPENVMVNFVTAAYFTDQAPPLARGRALAAALDETPSSEPVAILSQRFWERRLGSAPDILGQSLRLNGKSVRVVGILRNPREHHIDVWMAVAKQPHVVDGSKLLVDWTSPSMHGTARLNPGVSVHAAEAESRALAAALRESHPEAVGKDERLSLTPFSSNRMHPQEVVAAAMAATLVMLILVVACANLGSLLLARGIARDREIRTRLALGASRVRVVRQMLTESTLLAAAGSLMAWLLSAVTLQVFLTEAGDSKDWSLALDWRVMASTVVIALLAVLVFGLAPALRLTGSAPRGGRARSVFLAAQVGASCVLLMISGQLVRSFGELLKLNPDFDYQKVLTISPELHGHGYDDSNAKQYFAELHQRLSTVPGVERACLTWLRVWGDTYSGFFDGGRNVMINRVDGDFIATLGLHLSRGRNFASYERDVALVSESFARWHWPGEDPIGKRLSVPVPATVVGVVTKAGTFDIQDANAMGVYYPLTLQDYGDATVVIRVAGVPGTLAGTLIGVAGSQDSKLRPVVGLLRTTYDNAVAQSRTRVAILGLLGLLATMLAAIGLAGLTGYTVSQRTREIGVRIALGADRPRVVRAVVRPLAFPVAAGMVSGMLIAGVISTVLRNNLSSLRPADPLAYFMAIGMFVFVIALAVSVPARRAVRIQPAEALRHE
jgi:predicted permease